MPPFIVFEIIKKSDDVFLEIELIRKLFRILYVVLDPVSHVG